MIRQMDFSCNNFGPETAHVFARVLIQNTSLKHLNLDSNQLTLEGTDQKGVVAIADSLEQNSTLLHLNLCNNGISMASGELFREKLANNKTLICFDYALNDIGI